MKKFRLPKHILALFMALMPALAFAVATENLRIMTYNIPYGNINTEVNTWEQRAIHIAEYVNKVSPDIMGWQEPVRLELIDLLHRMPGYAIVGHARDDLAEKGEYTPIMYKTERFYVEATGTYWLTGTPDRVSRVDGVSHNRIATWAVMVDKKTGAKFIYTNTHLSYENEATQLEQIKYLKPYMKEVSDKYGASLPHLLTGDFNMVRTSENYNYVKNYSLIMNDLWFRAKQKQNLNGASDNNCIDYIYATSKVNCSYMEWGTSYTADGYRMSDHHPVWADINWNLTNEDKARAAINEAWVLIDSTYTINNGRVNLVTTANISCDGAQPSYPISNVLDGSTSTFFTSLQTTPPNQPHYVQVKLTRDDVTNCRFNYSQRYHDTYGPMHRWQDVMVTASDDGQTWDYITEFYDFGGDISKSYSSENISLHKPYKYIRFSVMRTPSMTLRNGAPEWNMSEFRLYQNSYKDDSERFVMKEVDAAATALEAMIEEMKGYIATGKVTSTRVTNFQNGIKALRDARQTTGITGVKATTDSASACYNLSGQQVSQGQKGLVISNGKKLLRK